MKLIKINLPISVIIALISIWFNHPYTNYTLLIVFIYIILGLWYYGLKIYANRKLNKDLHSIIYKGLLVRDSNVGIYCRKVHNINDCKFLLFDVTRENKFFDYAFMEVDNENKTILFTLYGHS